MICTFFVLFSRSSPHPLRWLPSFANSSLAARSLHFCSASTSAAHQHALSGAASSCEQSSFPLSLSFTSSQPQEDCTSMLYIKNRSAFQPHTPSLPSQTCTDRQTSTDPSFDSLASLSVLYHFSLYRSPSLSYQLYRCSCHYHALVFLEIAATSVPAVAMTAARDPAHSACGGERERLVKTSSAARREAGGEEK